MAMGLSIARRGQAVRPTPNITISTDNLATIQSSESPRTQSGQYLLKEIISQMVTHMETSR